MHHFVTEICTCVHISVTKWCIVAYLSNALWDLSTVLHQAMAVHNINAHNNISKYHSLSDTLGITQPCTKPWMYSQWTSISRWCHIWAWEEMVIVFAVFICTFIFFVCYGFVFVRQWWMRHWYHMITEINGSKILDQGLKCGCILCSLLWCVNTLRPRQDGRHFPDDIFKCIFLN